MSVGIERALAACTTHLPNWVRGKTRPPQVALAGWSRWRGLDHAEAVSVWLHSLPTCCVILACLLQKLQHRLSWPLSGVCVHFVSWGGTTETAHKQHVSRRLAI